MGVEYRHYLLPVSRPFRPDAAQVVALVQALRAARWITDPASAAFKSMTAAESWSWGEAEARESGACLQTKPRALRPVPSAITAEWVRDSVTGDAILRWPVKHLGDAKLEYPFDVGGPPDRDAHYDFELHFASDFVYHSSDVFSGVVPGTTCCGTSLEFQPTGDDIFYTSRLRTKCAKCGSPFDPSNRRTPIRNAWNGDPGELLGGCVYRFAIVIDCGKSLPNREGTFSLKRQLLGLCEKSLEKSFIDIGDAY